MEPESNNNRRLTKIGPYVLLKPIGKGSYSVVYEAYKQGQDRRQKYAIKKICIEGLEAKQLERIHLEINVLENIKHKNIVQLIDSKQTSRNLYLVFEYCQHTDLQTHIKKYWSGKLPEAQVKKIMIQLKNAFIKLRQFKIVHRDLKLQNILVTNDFEIKIADFGFAKSLSDNQYLKSWVGTLLTMAPEIIEKKTYNQKCDIWSLGVIMYQMLFGQNPFLKQSKMTHKQIKDSMKAELTFPSAISDSGKDLICRMLIRDSTKRCSFQEFFDHPWFTEGVENEDDNLDSILLQEALKVELHKNVFTLPKTLEEKKFMAENCTQILCYSLIEFVRGTIENELMYLVNLGKKLIDIEYGSESLNFLALSVVVDNINYVLRSPISITLNMVKIIALDNYDCLKGLVHWEESVFSRRLPNFLQKSKSNFEEFLKKKRGYFFDSPISHLQKKVIQLYLENLISEVSRADADRSKLKSFVKLRPTDICRIEIKLESGMISDKTLNLLLKRLQIREKINQPEHSLKRFKNMFKCTLVKRGSDLDRLYDAMKMKLSD